MKINWKKHERRKEGTGKMGKKIKRGAGKKRRKESRKNENDCAKNVKFRKIGTNRLVNHVSMAFFKVDI